MPKEEIIMKKNNTIYKHILRVFLCTLPCFSVSAMPYVTDLSDDHTDDGDDSLDIEVRSSDIGWKYKTVNGVIYKRKYDYTSKKWIGKWIRVN